MKRSRECVKVNQVIAEGRVGYFGADGLIEGATTDRDGDARSFRMGIELAISGDKSRLVLEMTNR